MFEMGRCLLLQANLGKVVWPYAVMTAAYICKLDPRCAKGIFLGYNKASPAYLMYIPETGKIMEYRVVKFPRRGVEQQTQTKGPLSDDDFMPSQHNTNPDICGESDVDKSGKGPDQLAEGPKAENETSPTSQSHDESVRSSKRERKLPSYLRDYVTDMEDSDQVLTSIDYCYKFSAFPRTYQEAMESPESRNWEAAMKEEMNSLTENNTFTLSTLPEGKNSVGGCWVYTIKESSTGARTFKARYVAKGYSQVRGVDYQETFAPTANLTIVHVLMQIAAQHDLILHQMDVKTAYLNAPIDCEIYMDQAEGLQVPSGNERKLVYKLNKSLYGLKQLGRNWNCVLHCFLLENNFVQSPVTIVCTPNRLEVDLSPCLSG